MKLVVLRIDEGDGDAEDGELAFAFLVSLLGSNICQTLETLHLANYDIMPPLDDVQVATALACRHNLKSLYIIHGR